MFGKSILELPRYVRLHLYSSRARHLPGKYFNLTTEPREAEYLLHMEARKFFDFLFFIRARMRKFVELQLTLEGIHTCFVWKIHINRGKASRLCLEFSF